MENPVNIETMPIYSKNRSTCLEGILFFPFLSKGLLLHAADTHLPITPVQQIVMSNLPNPPPYSTHNTPHLRDITLATITTVLVSKYGNEKEVSCVSLWDLIVDSGLDPIPMCIDAAWICRLSYGKWIEAVIEDVFFPDHRQIRRHLPSHSCKIWIAVGTKQLRVFPSDRGFRAAIAKWFALNSEQPASAITIFMARSDEEPKVRYVLSVVSIDKPSLIPNTIRRLGNQDIIRHPQNNSVPVDSVEVWGTETLHGPDYCQLYSWMHRNFGRSLWILMGDWKLLGKRSGVTWAIGDASHIWNSDIESHEFYLVPSI